MGRISSLLNDTSQYSALVKSEVGGGKLLWEAKMLYSFLRYGAKPVDYWRFQFWRKSASECDKYFTSMRYSRVYRRLQKLTNNIIRGGKIYEYKMFDQYIKREWIVVDSKSNWDDVLSFIEKHQIVIAKPNNGEQGRGIFKIKFSDKHNIEKLAKERVTTVFVVEELLKNIPILDSMNSSSLNTIRCFTFIDKNGNINVLEVILRVGRKGMDVDNWGSGGISYYFDVESGICKMGIDKQNKVFYIHPDSMYKMIGFELPDYKNLLLYVNELASVNRNARFVGWDIALTPNGYDLIEMNCPGGHDIMQAGGSAWGQYLKENW